MNSQSGWIGFNDEKVQALINQIGKNYEELADTIIDAWKPMVNTLDLYWIGPNQKNFLKTLAKMVSTNYKNLETVVRGLEEQIMADYESYVDYVNEQKFSINDVEIDNKSQISVEVEIQTINSVNLETMLTVSEEYSGDKIGLNVNEKDKITAAIQTYYDAITDKLNELFSNVTAEGAFFGNSVPESMNEYIISGKNYMNSVLTYIESIINVIDSCQEGSTTFEETIKGIIDNATEEIKGMTTTSSNASIS